MSADVLFSPKILVRTKKKVFVVRDKSAHFLQGPLIFSEALGFSLLSLYANPALLGDGNRDRNGVVFTIIPAGNLLGVFDVRHFAVAVVVKDFCSR